MGNPFAPSQLRSKNWLVLGSSVGLAGERVTWSTALSLRLHGRRSARHSASDGWGVGVHAAACALRWTWGPFLSMYNK